MEQKLMLQDKQLTYIRFSVAAVFFPKNNRLIQKIYFN